MGAKYISVVLLTRSNTHMKEKYKYFNNIVMYGAKIPMNTENKTGNDHCTSPSDVVYVREIFASVQLPSIRMV